MATAAFSVPVTTVACRTAIPPCTEKLTLSAMPGVSAVIATSSWSPPLPHVGICSGLVRQFGFRTVVVGESRNFQGGVDWLRSLGVNVLDLDSEECVKMLSDYIRQHPETWNEDIGEE
jgi:hypothetical protein